MAASFANDDDFENFTGGFGSDGGNGAGFQVGVTYGNDVAGDNGGDGAGNSSGGEGEGMGGQPLAQERAIYQSLPLTDDMPAGGFEDMDEGTEYLKKLDLGVKTKNEHRYGASLCFAAFFVFKDRADGSIQDFEIATALMPRMTAWHFAADGCDTTRVNTMDHDVAQAKCVAVDIFCSFCLLLFAKSPQIHGAVPTPVLPPITGTRAVAARPASAGLHVPTFFELYDLQTCHRFFTFYRWLRWLSRDRYECIF
jgi:hypothetical protein